MRKAPCRVPPAAIGHFWGWVGRPDRFGRLVDSAGALAHTSDLKVDAVVVGMAWKVALTVPAAVTATTAITDRDERGDEPYSKLLGSDHSATTSRTPTRGGVCIPRATSRSSNPAASPVYSISSRVWKAQAGGILAACGSARRRSLR